MIIVIDAREIAELSEIIKTLSNQDFAGLDKVRLRASLGIIKEMENSMSDFLNSRFSSVMTNSSAGSSARESASLMLDKRQSLESKLVGASSEKISCLQKTISLLNQCIGDGNQSRLQNDKELKVLEMHF